MVPRSQSGETKQLPSWLPHGLALSAPQRRCLLYLLLGADLEGEGVGVLAQFFDEPLLQPCQWLLVLGGRWEGLHVGHKQVLAKSQTQDIQVFPAIPEGAGQRHVDCEEQGH